MPIRNQIVWLACCAFTLLILFGNPNYQWSESRTSPFGADFVQEWVAGDMLLSGAADRIYDHEQFQQWQHNAERLGFSWPAAQYYPAVYPPPYYLLTAPLAWLPYRIAAVLWLVLLVAAYGAAASLAMRSWNDTDSRAQQLFWCVGLLLPAMFFGCVLGQKGSIWLLILSSSVYLLKRDRPIAAGCIAALLTLKPTLCGLLPVVMLIAGQWRFCWGFLGAATVLYAGTALMLPCKVWTEYVHVVLGASEYQSHAGYRSGWSTSLMSLVTAVGTPKLLSMCVLVVSGLALTLRCVRLAKNSEHANPMLQPQSLWLLLTGTALLSPHAYFYDLAWLLLPISGMLQTHTRRALRALAIVWIGMVLGQTYELGPAVPALSLVLSIFLDQFTRHGSGHTQAN